MEIQEAVEFGLLRVQVAAIEGMLLAADEQLGGDLTTKMVRNVMVSARDKYLDRIQEWSKENRGGK